MLMRKLIPTGTVARTIDVFDLYIVVGQTFGRHLWRRLAVDRFDLVHAYRETVHILLNTFPTRF